MAQELAESPKAVVGFAERRVLPKHRALQHRRDHWTVRGALKSCQRLRHERVEIRIVRSSSRSVVWNLSGMDRTPGGACTRARRAPTLGWFNTLEPFVEEKLVAGRWQQRGCGCLDTDADHPAVQLPQLVHEWCEVAVTGPEHEGRDVVAFEAQFDGIDGHLDVRRVLADQPHPLRYLDELDLVTREHPAIGVKARPVR